MTKHKMMAALAAEMIHVDCHPEQSRDVGEANASAQSKDPMPAGVSTGLARNFHHGANAVFAAHKRSISRAVLPVRVPPSISGIIALARIPRKSAGRRS
jgi:hypothetical protein